MADTKKVVIYGMVGGNLKELVSVDAPEGITLADLRAEVSAPKYCEVAEVKLTWVEVPMREEVSVG